MQIHTATTSMWMWVKDTLPRLGPLVLPSLAVPEDPALGIFIDYMGRALND